MNIGYDSEEVKQAVDLAAPLQQWLEAAQDFSRQMELFLERHELAETHAVCSVCEVPLAPYSVDDNHHVATLNNKNEHYCGLHCPACNSEGDDDEDGD